ncbi:XRE family transcriptional regulator [Streptomyces sp. DH12]|uniref:XRE family transcriptional regulator n=1 Tax=Streptomyces sp. DH12 TaxID=2857010 RepID=UPI001E508522|nr:XRE family transcriptional regulator [Streptomyces sp. DH12]
MPRWRALSEELDPQVREFAGQLRRLVDRSGLSIAAVADRTGYSRTSWERYLNGRLLAPHGAVLALADVTGTDPDHLTTLWELAERAWSRAEMRHDLTMESIRIAQARAALDDPGAGDAAPPADAPAPAPVSGTVLPPTAVLPATVLPVTLLPADGPPGRARPTAPADDAAPDYVPPGRLPVGPGTGAYAPVGRKPGAARPAPAPSGARGRAGRTAVSFLAGALGALLVVVAAVLLTDLGGPRGDRAADADGAGVRRPAAPPAPPASSVPAPLPEGVRCSGAACGGQDPQVMGCGGRYATTVASTVVATTMVEVRYSQVCGAAWARVSQAAPGDVVSVTAPGGPTRAATVDGAEDDAYTPMVVVGDGTDAGACAALRATGVKGCTATP